MEQLEEWRGAWTASDPAAIGFAWAPNEGGEYVARDDGLAYRDLGLEAASSGALGVSRVRVRDASAAGAWRTLDLDFDFLYVLTGSVGIEDDGGTTTLEAGGTAWHPRGSRYRLVAPSDDLELVHVTSPAWD